MNDNLKKLFLELYQMIISDSEVHPHELELLYQLGRDKGITEKEIQMAVFSPNNLFSSELLSDEEKITYLFNLAQIAWADGNMDEKEKNTMYNTCRRFGFGEEYILEISDFLLTQAENKKSISEVLQIIQKL